jgi:regulator of ribonuclease activity A
MAAACSTADLYDEHTTMVKVLTPMFRNYGGIAAFHGEIATVKVYEDNKLVREALDNDGKGKVLVIDGGGSLRTALVGDKLAQLALDNRWAGIIVNGCIRDAADVRKIAVGVRALNTNPARPTKNGTGEVRIPVSFGGVTMTPGEHIYADEDGILVSKIRLM